MNVCVHVKTRLVEGFDLKSESVVNSNAFDIEKGFGGVDLKNLMNDFRKVNLFIKKQEIDEFHFRSVCWIMGKYLVKKSLELNFTRIKPNILRKVPKIFKPHHFLNSVNRLLVIRP